jgi:hypothetical protein
MTEPRFNPGEAPPGRPAGSPQTGGTPAERAGLITPQEVAPPQKSPAALNARQGIWLMFFGLFLFAVLVTSHHIIAGSVALTASLAAGTMIVLLYKDRD